RLRACLFPYATISATNTGMFKNALRNLNQAASKTLRLADDTARLAVLSPYDRSLIDTLDYHSADDANTALDRAVALYQDRSQWIPAHERMAILNRLGDLVEKASGSFAELIAMEGGKPLRTAQIEVERAVFGIRHAASQIPAIMGSSSFTPDITPLGVGKHFDMRYEPIGPVVAICAFNHPLNLVVHQAAPAIAVGCPVIIKPDLRTPLCALKFAKLAREAGLPEGWCETLICPNDIAEALACDPRTAFLSFIGSAKVGWHLRSKIAPGTRCALEHGGTSPAILLPYADHDAAIPTLLRGGMTHAGQVCTSVQRVYVPWAEAGHIARKMGEAAEKLKVGNPLHEDTDVGPMITPEQVERVHRTVQDAIARGAKLMCGGEKEADTLYKPTILLDAPEDCAAVREEIFGPVICVNGYEDVPHAIARANDSPYAFQAAVWGRSIDDVKRAVDQLNFATVMVNDHCAFRVDWMPFGGHKQSGLGVCGTAYTMRDYTRHKLVVS
ncbi:MAG: aldehyde dehydrogenase family protein, partial [Polymorphobacter sp.]